MESRSVGSQGLVASAQGLGCMGMSEFYGARDEGEAIATIHRARELGIDFLDTADMYGPHTNERLVGKAIAGRRDQFVVSTKFGIRRGADGSFGGIAGDPATVRACCEASLERLGIETIDLYTQHRVDPTVPIEDTVGAMSRLVEEGKVRFLGLSEASAATIRRAHATHPISALQSELSLFSRDVEAEVLPTCRELGIGFVAYSPVGRGFLTGAIRSIDDLAADDHRRNMPRFRPENFARNLELVSVVSELASVRGVTPAALALAWVHAQGKDVLPIPGTKRRPILEENVAAFDLELAPDDLAALDRAYPPDVAQGLRYPEIMMPFVNG